MSAKQQEVAIREEAPAESSAIIQMIDRAVSNPNTGIDTLERLLAMQERVMDRHAKTAFMRDLASMQTELPEIQERGEIKISKSADAKGQKYALWEDINKVIKPIMQKYGFALSFRTGMTGDKISVTGVLSHKEGHSEETTIYLPADQSGSKNAVQAVGSSTSYGKRYTASALLNLTSRGEDDDGVKAGIKTVTQEQADKLIEMLEAKGAPRPAFLKWAKVEKFEDIPAEYYESCVAAINSYAPKKG